MDDDTKVFTSDILRANTHLKNNLYDLLKVKPARHLPVSTKNTGTCNFIPKEDKVYIPKKKLKLKVKTVRHVRELFEKDIYSYLDSDIERQRNILLRKIKTGSSKEEKTKKMTVNIMKNDSPICRDAWQMLVNLNPFDNKHPTQFILWNGKKIQICGSRGGTEHLICKYDLGKIKSKLRSLGVKNNSMWRKKSLLQSSLNVNFKPGPLSKKKCLDNSFQKFQFGCVTTVKLPRPVLDVQPTLGVPFDSTMRNFLCNNFMQDNYGTMSEKWADFSVSVLGEHTKDGKLKQNPNDCITFDLYYRCQQNIILMRENKDYEDDHKNLCDNSASLTHYQDNDWHIVSEVKTIMEKIIDSVEISLNQNNMFTSCNDVIVDAENNQSNLGISAKEKNKKRYYGELGRLDVTVIQLTETEAITNKPDYIKCQKSYCLLGCVCQSLECAYNLKSHCGRIQCMFKCQCNFSKYVASSTDCQDRMLRGLINIDNKNKLLLAKEERKFHQTVILSGDKSVFIKPKRRDLKSSKKYEEFYSSTMLNEYAKHEPKLKQNLSVVVPKLYLDNIETWCMVHKLYKCFCKGKFTNSAINKAEESSTPVIDCMDEPPIEKSIKVNNETTKNKFRMRTRHLEPSDDKIEKQENLFTEWDETYTESCARVQAYTERKFSNGYYMHTNNKIIEMEKNDKSLRNKLTNIVQINDNDELNIPNPTDHINVSNYHDNLNEIMTNLKDPLSDVVRHDIQGSINSFNKIIKMETNDNSLINKQTNMVQINNNNELNSPNPTDHIDVSNYQDNLNEINSNLKDLLSDVVRHDIQGSIKSFNNTPATAASLYNSKRLHSKSKLVAWLEESYKQYKEQFEQGITTTSLDPPRLDKVTLYPWDFILGRYREKKNLFLISRQKPFRIFMAVNMVNPFFDNCMNINDINSNDLQNYPTTVRNLLTNAIDLKDNFCILYGLSHCWELIGSVTKINELNKEQVPNNTETPITVKEYLNNNSSFIDEESHDSNCSENILKALQNGKLTEQKDVDSNLSKWFILTVENDFTEIHFYKKGFFVKYESVMKAINVSRVTGKTVRLSSQKCNGNKIDAQFGLYAVPNKVDLNVFIGPYEKDEPLGIETIKKLSKDSTKKTRGTWIMTDKVDNLKMIDEPLSFLPLNLQMHETITLDNEVIPFKKLEINTPVENNRIGLTGDNEVIPFKKLEINTPVENNRIGLTGDKQTKVKNIKPIKIRRSSTFYHLTGNAFQPAKTQEPDTTALKSNLVKQYSNTNTRKVCEKLSTRDKGKNTPLFSKPIAEIAPQLKLVKDDKKTLISLQPKPSSSQMDGCMFILKPEDINKKALMQSEERDSNIKDMDEIAMDIENFLVNSDVCKPPHTDICIISDDDDCHDAPKDVWIQSKNIEHLGWIPAKRGVDKLLSFKFPGFKYTDFYDEKEAFHKINLVFTRKVYVPRNLKLEWEVIERKNDLKQINALDSKDLSSDLIMTSRGLKNRHDVIKGMKTLKNKLSNDMNLEAVKKKMDIFMGLEEASSMSGDESSVLNQETVSDETDPESISKADDILKREMSNQLNKLRMKFEP